MRACMFGVVATVLLAWGLVACSDDTDAGGSAGASGASGSGGSTAGSGGATGGSSGATGGTGGSTGGSGGSGGSTGGSGGSTGVSGGSTGGSGGTTGGSGGSTGGSGGATGDVPSIAGCPVFTDDDDWNRDISQEPVSALWTQRILNTVGDINLHPDFGNWQTEHYGIPINVVPEAQPMVPVEFDSWPEESDPGPYPFPDPGSVIIEGGDPYNCGGDCHVLTVQQGTCKLYEGFACGYAGQWHCANGAVWDLTKLSYGQRPMEWTSADAAGLPIASGLIRHDEVVAGEIKHAIRFTLDCSRSNYVKPATHQAGNCGNADEHPPMGIRVRLNASYDISGFNTTSRVILQAMKTYGMILADNGADFYFQGEVNTSWNDDIDQLKDVPVSEFEVIEPEPMGP